MFFFVPSDRCGYLSICKDTKPRRTDGGRDKRCDTGARSAIPRGHKSCNQPQPIIAQVLRREQERRKQPIRNVDTSIHLCLRSKIKSHI
jgi:hypothetical protein